MFWFNTTHHVNTVYNHVLHELSKYTMARHPLATLQDLPSLNHYSTFDLVFGSSMDNFSLIQWSFFLRKNLVSDRTEDRVELYFEYGHFITRPQVPWLRLTMPSSDAPRKEFFLEINSPISSSEIPCKPFSFIAWRYRFLTRGS